MNIVVKGLLTHYTRSGAGKLIIIIPGWADTSASWQTVQKELNPEYDAVVLDLPGFGGTQPPPGAWGLDDYAEFAGEFIAKIGAGEPYAIIGHSNGGAVAIRALAGGKITCRRLVLLASAGIRGQAKTRKQAFKFIAKAGKILTALLPVSARNRLRRKLYRAAGSDMLVAGHMQETFKKVVATDIQADAAKLTAPCLLIYGDKDTDTPLVYGQKLNGLIKGSRLETVSGAGHFVFLQQPALVLTYIKDFLKS